MMLQGPLSNYFLKIPENISFRSIALKKNHSKLVDVSAAEKKQKKHINPTHMPMEEITVRV